MKTSFRSLRDFLLLFLWGSFVLWMTLSRQLSTYLHPTLQPYTVVAGVVLIILALFSLRGIFKSNHDHGKIHEEDHGHGSPGRCFASATACCHGHENDHHHEEHDHGVPHEEHDHEHHQEHHDHEHSHEEHEHDEHHDCAHAHHHHGEGSGVFSLIFKTTLLLLPLAVVLLGQNNHYTMSTINNRGIVQDISKLPSAKASPIPAAPASVAEIQTNAAASGDQSSSDQPANNADGSMPIQVIDLLYAVQMPTYREEFEGKKVELIGQFVPLTIGNPKGDRFQTIRLFITCCAADAKPVGVTVQYDKPLHVSEMGWVKIIGTPTFPMEGGRRTAVLVASKVEECPAPTEPFVY